LEAPTAPTSIQDLLPRGDPMKRREFIALLGGAVLASPVAARGQAAKKRPLVAWLGGSSPQNRVAMRNRDAFVQGLREHGYEDGKNVDLVYRWADGDISRLPQLATELVALNPAVIVSAANTGTIALRQATSVVPIVGVLLVDPIAHGLAESHNRPGANITGLLQTIDSLPGKQAEVLIELVPQANRIGVLVNPANRAHPGVLRDIDTAVRGSSVKAIAVEMRNPFDFEALRAPQTQSQIDGLMVLNDPLFFTHATRIIELAAAARLPAIHNFRQHVELGGLMSYGVADRESFRRAGYFVDRILKGERPGDLPIELPSKLELVINLKAAKALGIEVPPTLLARADEVIE
jgi:putative tryptophan/tyrosine transport system substrate-binding protein